MKKFLDFIIPYLAIVILAAVIILVFYGIFLTAVSGFDMVVTGIFNNPINFEIIFGGIVKIIVSLIMVIFVSIVFLMIFSLYPEK